MVSRRVSALTRLVLLLLLVACARPAMPVAGFRRAEVPIGSIALFQQSQLSGHWLEIAGYPLRPGCTPGAYDFAADGRGVSGGGCFLPLRPGMLVPSGPGRFTSAAAVYWVLWVDADRRTLAIGTPSGGFAAILNRDGPISDDRLTAAKRVLAFNGYDVARLEGR